MLTPLGVPSERFLDVSYAMVLAHMLKIGARAGVDYVFNYGPLGYFRSPLFVDELFAVRTLWDVLFHFAVAIVFVHLVTRMPTRTLKVVYVSCVVLLLPQSEALYLVAIVGAGFELLTSERWPTWLLALVTAIWATLSLVKFTFFALGVATLCVASAGAPSPNAFRRAGTLVGFFVTWLLVAWTAARQPLTSFVPFVRYSVEISTGYSDGMLSVTPGALDHVIAAEEVLAFLACIAALALPVILSKRRSLLVLVLVAAGLFLSFKESFVRQDVHHETVFFAFAAMSTLWLAMLPHHRDIRALQVAFGFLAMMGSLRSWSFASGELLRPTGWIPARVEMAGINLTRLPAFAQYRAYLKTLDERAREKLALPQICRYVGRRTVDMVSVDQQTLLMNGMNYKPRPVFQSYTAYTPALTDLNGAFFRSRRAPEFVITNWMPIDGRYLPHDDPATFFELIWRYQPVLREQDYVLFEKRPKLEHEHRGKVILRRRFEFGKVLKLPWEENRDKLMTISLQFRYTARGKMRKFFFRGEPVDIELRVSNHRIPRRILPTLAQREFLINPLVNWDYDLLMLYDHQPTDFVRAIRIETTDAGKEMFEQEIVAVVKTYPLPPIPPPMQRDDGMKSN